MKERKHLDLLKIFMKDKHTKTMGAIIILLVATLYVVCIDYILPERVTVVYATMEGNKKTVMETRAGNVEDAVSDTKLGLSKTDAVTPCREHEVDNGMTINVLKSVKSTAVIGGKTQTFYLYPGTVKENLKHNNIDYDNNDIVTPSLDTEVDENTQIEVKEVHQTTVEKTEDIKAVDEVILDPGTTSGKITTTSGSDGSAVCEYVTTYVNGENTGTEKVIKKWIKKTVNHSMKFGTSVTGESGSVSYSRTFTGNTTAYYMGESAYGAGGSRCHYGTCAVDPSVIPYGTKLYIVGYGYAVANDCGSAVKGNVVDLYMRSVSECNLWGRRYVKVYVLK